MTITHSTYIYEVDVSNNLYRCIDENGERYLVKRNMQTGTIKVHTENTLQDIHDKQILKTIQNYFNHVQTEQ